MAKSIYPSIPAPGNDMPSIQASLGAMRQTLNMMILNAQHPNPNFAPSSAAQVFVTYDQLHSLGVVNKSPSTGNVTIGSGVQGPPGLTGPAGPVGPTGPPGGMAIPDAPSDGKSYARRNGAWVDVSSAHYVRIRCVSTTLNNAVPNGVTGVLRFDTVDDDTSGYMVGASPWSAVTIPAGLGGVHIINGWSSGSGNQSTTLGMGILVNSTQLTGTNQSISGPGSVNYTLDNAAVAILRLNAGDIVELFNTSVTGVSDAFTSVYMSVARLGA